MNWEVPAYERAEFRPKGARYFRSDHYAAAGQGINDHVIFGVML